MTRFPSLRPRDSAGAFLGLHSKGAPMATNLYDPRCEELARVFLDDQDIEYNDADAAELAGVIQRAIEDWMAV
jgi:hypothetical protein